METKNFKSIFIGLAVILALSAAYLTVVQISGRNFTATDNLVETQIGSVSSSPVPLGAPMVKRSGLATEQILPAAGGSFSSNVSSQTVDPKVIKNGNLNLKVSSLDDAAGKINQIAEANGGSVFSSNFYNNNNAKSGWLTVKVPVANFEKTVGEIKKVASLVVQESTTGQDVTEEYTDLQAQIKNKQAEEQQYQNILSQAQKVQDILDVTAQLSRVRGEIESLQGRIKFLNSQADLASISVNLTEDTNVTVSDSWRPLQVAKDAINTLIRKSQGFVNFAIILVITVIPIAFLYLVLLYILYRIGKKIYLKVLEKRSIGNQSS